MDDGSSLIGALIVFATFILVNGSLYGFGAAIQKVSEADVEKKAGEQNDKKSQWILEIMANPATIINTILTTATLLSILIGYIGIHSITPYVYTWIEGLAEAVHIEIPPYIGAGISVVLVLVFFLITLMSFGVISAKKVFNHNPDKWVYRTAGVDNSF